MAEPHRQVTPSRLSRHSTHFTYLGPPQVQTSYLVTHAQSAAREINRLPREVLGAIARYLVDGDFSAGGLRSLAHLASASRAWHAIADPLLHALAVQYDMHHFSPSYQDPWKVSSRPKHRDAILISAAEQGKLPLLRRLTSQLTPDESLASLFTRNFLVSWPCDDHDFGYQPAGVPRATILHAAAVSGHDEVVEWILCHQGVAIDCTAYLWCLCPSTHMRLFPWECDRGVEDEPGMRATPLHLALAHGRESTARVLIEHGAVWDRPLLLSGAITGLHLMASNGLSHVINWIAEGKARSQTIEAADGQHQQTYDGREHDWPDDWGRSALHFAAFAPATRSGIHGNDLAAAAHLVNGLVRLGAVWNTRDRTAIAQRITAERQRLLGERHCGHEGSVGHDGNEKMADWRSKWSLRIRHGEELVLEAWCARAPPVEYALYRGNGAVAVAIAASAARQSTCA